MTSDDLPPEFLDLLRSITNKRPRIVIEHILEHGYITTEELREIYGYNHPPRAARDVREQGVPLVTFKVEGRDGRKIAAYKFGDLSQINRDRLGGRKAISKQIKDDLISINQTRCAICLEEYDAQQLHVDHRVPYEVIGDEQAESRSPNDYMLLCGSCNRAKSWSCEQCDNWRLRKLAELCLTCYWANPENYEHIALRPLRRLDIVWTEHETQFFDMIKQQAEQNEQTMQEYIKALLARHFRE